MTVHQVLKSSDSLKSRLAAHRKAQATAPLPQQPGSRPAAEDEKEDGEGLQCHVAWSSAPKYRPSQAAEGAQRLPNTAAALKDQGNAALKRGDYDGALQSYSAALKAGEAEGAPPESLAVLHSNRAHALNKLGRHKLAVIDAETAARLQPGWPKPFYRLAQAHASLGQWGPAWVAGRRGERLVDDKTRGSAATDFTPLLDDIAIEAALHGIMTGFDSRRLEVRHAGDEAWLCQPAPEDPLLDYVAEQPTSLSLLALTGSGGGGATVVEAVNRAVTAVGEKALRQTRERTSFRSIKEAIEAARDGDVITLRRGTHNGLGACVAIKKRIMIRGEGSLGEVVIDQRANSSMFRITRACLLHNLLLDFTGFKDALHIVGPRTLRPIVQQCILKCSGDDAVNVCGQANPIIRGCEISAKMCGVRVYGGGRGLYQDCVFKNVQEAGLKAMDKAQPFLHRCTTSACEEEGVLAMDRAHVHLEDCTITACKGPGLDLSGRASAQVVRGSIGGCVGGLFMWEDATAKLEGVDLEGGSSHVILADADAMPQLQECRVTGTVHATELAWEGIWNETNKLMDPREPADLPAEEGPFKFVPDPYRRKQ